MIARKQLPGVSLSRHTSRSRAQRFELMHSSVPLALQGFALHVRLDVCTRMHACMHACMQAQMDAWVGDERTKTCARR